MVAVTAGGSGESRGAGKRMPAFGPGSGARAAGGRRRALRRPGHGRGARPLPPPVGTAPAQGDVGPGVTGVTRRGLELNLAPQRAVSTRACPRRQISAPACSRTQCFRKSTHKYTWITVSPKLS